MPSSEWQGFFTEVVIIIFLNIFIEGNNTYKTKHKIAPGSEYTSSYVGSSGKTHHSCEQEYVIGHNLVQSEYNSSDPEGLIFILANIVLHGIQIQPS